MSKEDKVVAYINGALDVPAPLEPMVRNYRKLQQIVDDSVSYPKVVDLKMNLIYDTLVEVVD